MTDITHTKIEVKPSKLRCLLQVEWGPESAVKLRLLHRESAWVGELSESEIRSFVTQYELELANFMEDMRAAFRAPSSENYIFSLNADTFSWKRPLASGLVAKLGQVKMSKVTPIDAFELVLEQSLGLLSTFEESVKKYKTENQTLTKERDTALSRVIEMSELKANWEKKIYGQFVVVLNAKKERIQALEELLDLKDSDGPQSADGEPRAGKDEVMDDDNDANSSDDDPYAGDTDVDDVDTDEDVKMEPATAPSSSTSTLRRGSELFSSFDSPDSPNPPLILAKRARVSKPASTASTSNASSSTASSSTTSATSVRNIFKDVVEDEPDEAVTGESTQDLIGQL